MRSLLLSKFRKRWPLLVLSAALGTGAVFAGVRLQALVRRELPRILKAKLQAAAGRPVAFGSLHVTPAGIWIDDLRVPRIAPETEDPLTARRVRVTLDWWR